MLLLDRVSPFMHWDLSRTVHGPPRSAAYPCLCACKWAGGCVFAHLIGFYRRFVLKRKNALGHSVAFHVYTHSEHSCSSSPRITANIWLSLHILLALTQISAPGLFFMFKFPAGISELTSASSLHMCVRHRHWHVERNRSACQSIGLTAHTKRPEKWFVAIQTKSNCHWAPRPNEWDLSEDLLGTLHCLFSPFIPVKD